MSRRMSRPDIVVDQAEINATQRNARDRKRNKTRNAVFMPKERKRNRREKVSVRKLQYTVVVVGGR